MSLTLITPPDGEPITLVDAKKFAKIEHDLEDSLVERLIVSVRQLAEQLTRAQLLTATWKLSLDQFSDVIRLPRPPLQSVTHIKYIDAAGALQTVDPADYVVETGGAQPGVQGSVQPAYGKVWPSARYQPDAVQVTYVAGYGAAGDTVPGPIMDWMLVQLVTRYENRQLLEAGQLTELRFVDALLNPYRVRIVP